MYFERGQQMSGDWDAAVLSAILKFMEVKKTIPTYTSPVSKHHYPMYDLYSKHFYCVNNISIFNIDGSYKGNSLP